jgi:hypothetical protein
MRRSRWRQAGWIVVVIAAGLASRSWAAAVLPDFIAAHAGDTLWALMVFLMLGFAFPGARTAVLAAAAVGVSFVVEFSQLVHVEWLDRLRATRAGALVLGRGFLATDLLCYLAGVALGVAGEKAGYRNGSAES